MEYDATIRSGIDAPVLIDRFTGPWEFLSNYYPAAVCLDGAWYPAVENAYQAAKTRDPEVRERIAAADPDEAKRLGRLSLDQPGWEEMKVAVMRGLVGQKFRDERMRRLLLSTGTAELVEGNDWGDDFWGMCGGRGQNFMGLILMAVRARAIRDAAGSVPVITGGAAGVGLAARASIPTVYGPFTAWAYRGVLDGSEHLALTAGNVRGGESVLVRVHSECLTGEALGSLRSDCGPQLDAALAAVAGAGTGAVLYMRGHEGRGIGLLAKLRAYALQNAGFDTVDANSAMGLPEDARDYRAAARILADLGVRSIRLLSNNPAKTRALTALGIKVTEQLPLITPSNQHNIGYLMTKRDRMGHELPGLPGQDRLAGLVT